MIAIETRTASGGRDEDRLLVERSSDRLVVVVADGAGGVGGGAEAAQAVCDLLLERIRGGASGGADWNRILCAIDASIERLGGLSTAVVLEIREGTVVGASVGDSGAWMVRRADVVDFTEHQTRKPLLGSGVAVPVRFGPLALDGRLLAATDGLFKYAPLLEIAAHARGGTLAAAASALLEAVRLPNGDRFDDVALVLCEEIMQNTLSGVVSACMTAAESPPVSLQTRP